MLALFHPLAFGPLSQFLPVAICLCLLAKLWWNGQLYGLQQAAFVAWLMTALGMQLASQGPWMWIAGYVGQVVLAIVLVVKDRIGDIS